MAIIAFHFIFSAYGFWLPNDPRGSWSETVRAFNLQRFGPSTRIETTDSVAGAPHDRKRRFAAKQALTFRSVQFTGEQARAIARGFAAAVKESHYRMLALAILPDHVHLVTGWHERHIDKIAAHLKAKATMRMSREGIHPLAAYSTDGRVPTPWARITGARLSITMNTCALRFAM